MATATAMAMGAEGGGAGGAGELRAQLERARLGLQRLERDIRRAAVLNARHHVDRNNDRGFQNANSARGGPRGAPKGGFDGFNPRSFAEDRQTKKRPQETKTVFSRLSARPTGDSDLEEETTVAKKPRISSQVTRDLPTKQEVLKAQEGDEQSKARNRRIFGSLLGTLQKFKQESIVLQNKEDKKAQVEKKIEEQAKLEKENQKKERQNLFAEREIKKATIKALEAKMIRMREFEKWETAHASMLGFVQTKGKPNIFWKPKKMSEAAHDKLNNSKKILEKIIEKKRQDVASELSAIEQRCLRNIRLPPGSQQRPSALFDSSDFNNSQDDIVNNENDSHNSSERVQRASVVIKQEKDDSDNKLRIKSEARQSNIKLEEDRTVENGKSQSNEKWKREESGSSSDENDDNSAGNVNDKDHLMEDFSRIDNDNIEDDPDGVNNQNINCSEAAAKNDNVEIS